MKYYFVSYHFNNTTQSGCGNITSQRSSMFSNLGLTTMIANNLTKKGFSATPNQVVLLYWQEISLEEYTAYNSTDNNELKGNSTATDGTRLPGVDQGEVQSDSEVQQGDDREGSGSAGSEGSADSDRIGPTNPDWPPGKWRHG